jgi:hypothetical protein
MRKIILVAALLCGVAVSAQADQWDVFDGMSFDDTPAQAHTNAVANEQMRAAGYAIGQALINMGNGMNQPPVHCHPHTLQLGC